MRGPWLLAAASVGLFVLGLLWARFGPRSPLPSPPAGEPELLARGATHLAYEVQGDGGTPVLFFSPMGSVRGCYQPQVEALRGEHRVLTLDNRGTGQSGPLDGPLTLVQLAEDGLALLDHLGWERVHVVGLSMGGMIAQELALLAPERVLSLSLLATHSDGAGLPSASGILLAVRRDLALRLDRPRWARSALVRAMYSPEFLAGKDRAEREALGDAWGPTPDHAVLSAQVEATSAFRTTDRLGALADIPTLLVRTDATDRMVPPPLQQTLADALPHAQQITVATSGHGVTRERSEEVNRLLRAHLASVDGDR